jgi:PTH1 family peptidyl-tRNA hydrolase
MAEGSVYDWLIAGLGNPGSRYDNTPHNLGFEVAVLLAKRHGLRWSASKKARAEVADGRIGSARVLLAMPTTYMNLSGEAVGALASYYGIDAARIITITDDVALPYGKLRLREKGSHGGHNGLRSIIAHLGTDGFPRLRIGCLPDHPVADLAAFVLAPARGDRRELSTHMVEIAADAVEEVLAKGLGAAMNRYNAYDARLKDEG